MGTDADTSVNIVLQHWTGELNALAILSSHNISAYAKKVDAEYRLLRGDVFREGLSGQCQKVFMLDECWDDYDTVLMLDMDMFVRKGMNKDIFDPNITGVGIHTLMQWGLAKKLRYFYPHLGNRKFSYWGGAIYKLSREMRQCLRVHIRDDEMVQFTDDFMDEGIMHRLAVLAKVRGQYFKDDRWSFSSYEDGVGDSCFIHIRARKLIDGEKVMFTKMVNYRDLVARGLIEE